MSMLRRIARYLGFGLAVAGQDPSWLDLIPAQGPARDDFRAARRHLEPLARSGDAGAQGALGLIHALGLGGRRNVGRAVRWTRKAADQGHRLAQRQLGRFYLDGCGVRPDVDKALGWLRKAAGQHCGAALGDLGLLHLEGRGVPQDDGQARQYFEQAAVLGDFEALGHLGLLHWQGRGGFERDIHLGHELLLKAVGGGSTLAARRLGEMARAGEMPVADTSQPHNWFRWAAERGDPQAQAILARLALAGEAGHPPNPAEALKWAGLSLRLLPQGPAREIRDEARRRLGPAWRLLVWGWVRGWQPITCADLLRYA